MAQGKLVATLKRNPLVKTLLELKGNPRICVITEPLWGIPYNLYSPYATLFMYNLGVNDEQIGLLLTIGMINDMYAESRNDDYTYATLATQEDFDNF